MTSPCGRTGSAVRQRGKVESERELRREHHAGSEAHRHGGVQGRGEITQWAFTQTQATHARKQGEQTPLMVRRFCRCESCRWLAVNGPSLVPARRAAACHGIKTSAPKKTTPLELVRGKNGDGGKLGQAAARRPRRLFLVLLIGCSLRPANPRCHSAPLAFALHAVRPRPPVHRTSALSAGGPLRHHG